METPIEDAVYWIIRCENRLLTVPVDTHACPFPLARAADLGSPAAVLPVGQLGGRACVAVDLPEMPKIAGAEAISLRAVFTLAGVDVFALAGRAFQLLDWQRNHRFCGRCGSVAVRKPGEMAMACPECNWLAYPRISPAVMVLVLDGEKMLLGRSPHFKPGVFSALAGFVEPGETLEQCAVREVREEVGVAITNLRYFASQPWPFPDSLMVAFFADYAGGEIVPDPAEIEAAAWFTADTMPILPDPVSISRRLIDAALAQRVP